MEELIVVKIGGNIVDNPDALTSFLKDFSSVESKKILVHGGGKIATKVSASLGIETQMVEGRRITDAQTVKVVSGVYAGLINKSIVAQLNSMNQKTWGLCGADANIIPAHKREVKKIDYGYVGDIDTDKIAINSFDMLLNGGFCVVVAPITASPSGQLLNTNADTVAQSIAVAMSSIYKVKLVYVFEKNGVLRDIDDPRSVVSQITPQIYTSLKDQKIIVDGMIPKIDNAFEALKGGVESVRICNSITNNGTLILK